MGVRVVISCGEGSGLRPNEDAGFRNGLVRSRYAAFKTASITPTAHVTEICSWHLEHDSRTPAPSWFSGDALCSNKGHVCISHSHASAMGLANVNNYDVFTLQKVHLLIYHSWFDISGVHCALKMSNPKGNYDSHISYPCTYHIFLFLLWNQHKFDMKIHNNLWLLWKMKQVEPNWDF